MTGGDENAPFLIEGDEADGDALIAMLRAERDEARKVRNEACAALAIAMEIMRPFARIASAIRDSKNGIVVGLYGEEATADEFRAARDWLAKHGG